LAGKLLTLLTVPKPFKDPHISIIQTNALKSWLLLGEEVDVIVLGNDEGVAEKTNQLGIRHLPNVACNDRGTPLVSSMIELARSNSESPYVCIVNADIILFPDLLQALKNVAAHLQRFLILGQRWDMDVVEEIPEREEKFAILKGEVLKRGKLHPPMGSDYFIFPRECYQDIPDFAIGRAGWDNWFIFKSRWEGWPVIDATQDVLIIHQNHDYRHLPGGQTHYRLPETRENVIRGGGEQTIFTLADAQYELIHGRLSKKPLSAKKLLREIEIFPLTHLRSMTLGKLFFYGFHPRKGYQALRTLLGRDVN